MDAPVENEMPHAMTVGDLMSTIVHTAKEADTIRDAYATMRVARIRHLPVLGAREELIGVVSDRDLHLGWSRGPETRISEVMSRHLQWVHPETSARDAAARMLHDKIGCLPVVDDKQALVGIITDTDFLEVAHRALTLLQALTMKEAS